MQLARKSAWAAPDTVELWRGAWGNAQVGFAGRGLKPDREAGLRQLLPPGVEVAWPHQIHSAAVLSVGLPGCAGSGDALVTRTTALALAVVTADCVPVLLAGAGRVAAVHAGWRGIAAEILPATLDHFAAGELPCAWVGPAIGACCYEVGADVAAEVQAVSPLPVIRVQPNGRLHLDLQAAVTAQLAARGVTEVQRLAVCTRCDPRWWSFRRDGVAAGRNAAVIWLAPAESAPPKPKSC